jgi:hypothetical protein
MTDCGCGTQLANAVPARGEMGGSKEAAPGNIEVGNPVMRASTRIADVARKRAMADMY